MMTSSLSRSGVKFNKRRDKGFTIKLPQDARNEVGTWEATSTVVVVVIGREINTRVGI